MTRERFLLVLDAMPDRLGRDPVLRLRQALKLLSRTCHLRAVRVREIPPDGDERGGAEQR